MKRREKIVSICLLLVFIVFTILVKIVDVSGIGPENSMVGFSTINLFFHRLFDVNLVWYDITKYLGIIPFIGIFCYGVLGLSQLLKRKSLLKVDKKLIVLGIFYIIVGIMYVLFEKIVINYRPVILDGELEASYPSSHTMLAITTCMSFIIMNKYYIKNKKLLLGIDICVFILMILLVVGRLLSGVHWFTDIVGAILISTFLVYTFYKIVKKLK